MARRFATIDISGNVTNVILIDAETVIDTTDRPQVSPGYTYDGQREEFTAPPPPEPIDLSA
ncbi:hypothetical protein PSP31120_01556 [Pandoraea sputorum]|nr:hypothetical protein PSP31120_01556 [Pandoraea sputorum]